MWRIFLLPTEYLLTQDHCTNLTMKTGKAFLHFAGILAFFAILTVIMTYPSVFHMGMGYFGGDTLLTAWILAWDLHKAQEGFKYFWDANIFYPMKGTFAYSEHLLGNLIFFVPLSLFTKNILLMLNIQLLLTFILSGVSMYYLVRYLTGNTGAAIISGLIYAFYPYRFVHVERIHVLGSYCIPLVFLYWHKSMRDPVIKNLIPFALFFMVQTTVSGYLGVYTIFFTTLSTAVHFIRERNTRALMRTGAVIAIICILLLIFFLQYSQGRRNVGFLEGGGQQWSASPFSFLFTLPTNLMWGWIYRVIPLELDGESLLFPGLLALLLAIIGIRSLARGEEKEDPANPDSLQGNPPRKERSRWDTLVLPLMNLLLLMILAYCGVLFMQGAYGPAFLGYILRLGGMDFYIPRPLPVFSSLFMGALIVRILMDQRAVSGIRKYWHSIQSDSAAYVVMLFTSLLLTFYLFYHLLMVIFPGFSYMRVTARIFIVTEVALSVLAGFGVKSLLPRFKSRGRKALFLAILGLIILAEGACIPLGITDIPDLPSVYSHLPAGDTVLLELPSSNPRDVLYMFNSTKHWRKLVNGVSGFVPSYYVAFREEMNEFPTREGIKFLKMLNVDFVIIHGNLMPREKLAPTRKKLQELSCMEYRGEFEGDFLYKVLKDQIILPAQSGTSSLEEIPLKGCTFSSYPRAGSFRNPEYAADGRIETFWTTAKPQSKGQYFAVDMGRAYEVERIDLFLGKQCSCFPRYFYVQTSLDGLNWDRSPPLTGVLPLANYLANPLNPAFTINLRPVRARYIAIVLTEGVNVNALTISEIKIYQAKSLIHR